MCEGPDPQAFCSLFLPSGCVPSGRSRASFLAQNRLAKSRSPSLISKASEIRLGGQHLNPFHTFGLQALGLGHFCSVTTTNKGNIFWLIYTTKHVCMQRPWASCSLQSETPRYPPFSAVVIWCWIPPSSKFKLQCINIHDTRRLQ